MKKSLLIVYSKMIVGGSTTSLLSLLNEIDYAQYDVDLLLYEKGGVLDDQIPSEVTVLDNAFLKATKPAASQKLSFVYAYAQSRIHHNPLIRSQIMSRELAKSQPQMEKAYDVAIAYLEFWASQYVDQRVNAKRKILWLHFDYKGAGLDPRHDAKMYGRADAVVTVSEACRDNFKVLFPTVEPVLSIHNILSSKTVYGMAHAFEPEEELFAADLVFVTVARIDFTSKGHDRGVAAFGKMKQRYSDRSFRWLIIGDGPDRGRLEELIKGAGLEPNIRLLGEKTNPHPYVRRADVFLLPSRYEGKPMSVTEAQMNGVVPFVTDYASARGQIRHGQDGLICENRDEAITTMMDEIFSGKIDLAGLKGEVLRTDYSNSEEIEKIYDLLGK